MVMALKALDRCDVAVLVLDAMEQVSDQDATIAGYALDRGKGCLVLGNKWDLSRENEILFKEFEGSCQPQTKVSGVCSSAYGFGCIRIACRQDFASGRTGLRRVFPKHNNFIS